MQFVWPVKADYRIVYLSPDYAQTVIGREKRDYVWIMARTPQMPDADYERLLRFVRGQGYDVSQIAQGAAALRTCRPAASRDAS